MKKLLIIGLFLLMVGCNFHAVKYTGKIRYGEGDSQDQASWRSGTIQHDASNWGIEGGVELTFTIGGKTRTREKKE
jgi:hypothetical protein